MAEVAQSQIKEINELQPKEPISNSSKQNAEPYNNPEKDEKNNPKKRSRSIGNYVLGEIFSCIF